MLRFPRTSSGCIMAALLGAAGCQAGAQSFQQARRIPYSGTIAPASEQAAERRIEPPEVLARNRRPAALRGPASEIPSVTQRSEFERRGTASRVDPVRLVAGEPSDAIEAPLEAQAAAIVDGLALEQLEQIALAHNPGILAASASASKAQGARRQVGAWPNPTAGYFGSQLADAATDQQGAFISQVFVRGDKLALNRAVLDRDLQAQLWDVEIQRQRVLTDVRQRFFDALTAQRRLTLTDEFHEVAEQGVHVAERRRVALEGSQPEVLQAEIQLNEVDLSRERARIAFEAAWRQLAATAGVPNLTATRLVGELKPDTTVRDWDAIYVDLSRRSPELQAAAAMVRRAQLNIERQEAQPVPNVEVSVQAGYDRATGSQLANVQVGLPLPVFNANQGNIDAATAEYCRATQNARRVELSLKARLARTAQEFDSAAVTADRYETQILPRARETLRLSEQAYDVGEFSFLQVLIARRTFFESNLQYVQSLNELAQANAEIEGLLLTGGLGETPDFLGGDGLRGQALSGQ